MTIAIEFDVVAQAPLEDQKTGKKKWVFAAKRKGKPYLLVLNVGPFQMEQIELEIATDMQQPA